MANSSPSYGDTEHGDMDNLEPNATHAELLQAVLDEEQSAPWLHADSAAEYTDRLETAGKALEISDAEAAKGWQALSTQLGQLWDAGASELGVMAQLQQKFAERLPGDFLQLIAEKAQQVAGSPQPMIDQLISCVQSGLNDMATADLQVMARPMAFAMRGNSTEAFIDAAVTSIRVADWETLSPIEQARLSLAAARYAIAQINEG